MFFILVLTVAVVQLSIGFSDNSDDIVLLRALIGTFILIIIIMAGLLLYFVSKLMSSLQSEGQKSGLRSGKCLYFFGN